MRKTSEEQQENPGCTVCRKHVKIVATPTGTDYYDAISLGDKLCKNPRYMAEGGAKNVARRDGMGTTVLSAVEVIGRIPDAYFQAVGSGTGAIAAWENAERLAADGRFGKNNMRVYASQNAPFTIMYDSWKNHSRELVSMTPEESRSKAEVILGKVLSNRNIFPASACAVASLKQAIDCGTVKKDETIMLNVTGGGMLSATRKGFILKEPDLVLSPELPTEEIIAAIDKLF